MAKHKLGLLEQISTAFVNGMASLHPTRKLDPRLDRESD